MAETILFTIAEGVLGELGSFLGDEIGMLWGAKKDLKKLKSTMSAIKAVLLDAEKKQRHNDRVRDWLQKLEVVVYDADDLVDDFHIEALRRRVMPGNKLTKKVCIFFSSSNQLASRLKMGHKIKEIREALDEISYENTFQLVEQVEDTKLVSATARQTHSFVLKEEVFGRDGDKMKILELLLHGDETEENISIVTMVGIGGLGKTTLAQLVFNDVMVENHFEPRLWVCVSEVFDLKVIAGEIIKSATNGRLDQNLAMDQLQLQLREQIDGKRYFLVLDDVWNEDPIKWLELKSLLKSGARGSRVLVTTRSEKVAMITHSLDDQPIHLSGLEKAMSWSLFAKMAFRRQQDLEKPEIVDLGKEILEKCKGVPLTIKTIGSMLYSKNPRIDWLLFKDNELARVTQQGDGILATLRLSYGHLPSYLKHCFAYCSLFPKDHKFDVQRLINLWMAQGFVQADQNQCLEDIGYGYFLDLLWRSFFQEAEEDEWGNIRWCKMHDLMHDLAISMAGTRSVLMDKDSVSFSENLVHVSFDIPLNSSAFLRSLSALLKHNYKLRTLFCVPEFFSHDCTLDLESNVGMINLKEICSEFKSLRALGLQTFSKMQKLPKSLGELKHLRYLDLSHFSQIQKLPNSITKLQNLQTLNLQGCEKLSSLPRDMHTMVSLRHLVLDGCGSLSHMPSRLGELTCLQTLDRFVVGAKQSRRKNTSIGEVGELRNLNSLRGVLRIENLRADIEESENPNLHLKQRLRQLVLEFEEVDDDIFVEKYEKSLELLQPHANLKTLEVRNYMGVGFASWIKSLVNLVELELSSCIKCRYLPPLHVFPCLQQLSLYELHSLEYIGVDQNATTTSSGSSCDMPFFPSLKKLIICDCPKLTSMPLFPYLKELWLEKTSSKPVLQTMTMTMTVAQKEAGSIASSSSSSFQSLSKLESMVIRSIDDVQSPLQEEAMGNLSSLQSLHIYDCPNLTSLPEAMGNLSSLQSLHIYDCPNLTSLPEAMGNLSSGNLSSLQFLRIESCPNLTSLPEAMGNLSSLQSLHIYDCPNLTSLPEAIGNLSSLQFLRIESCPNLTSLPEAMGNLSSLQSLKINDCPNLTSLPEAMGNLSSLQSLHIRHCPNLTSLPETMGNLSSLQYLYIYDCPNLTSLPQGQMFRTLTTLSICQCPILQQRYNETSPMIAHIPNLKID